MPTHFVIAGAPGEPPRLPTAEDFGGYNKLDDDEFPPNPQTDLTASDWNQLIKTVFGMVRTMHKMVLRVQVDCSTPGSVSALSCSTLNFDLISSDFPLARITNGFSVTGLDALPGVGGPSEVSAFAQTGVPLGIIKTTVAGGQLNVELFTADATTGAAIPFTGIAEVIVKLL
jgi:hypothetical protein